MYIPANNYMTQGLRISFIHSLNNDKCYHTKRLRKIDDRLARDYTQTQLYGGSLKSFWGKIKNIGKHVINSAINTTKNMYKPVKWIIKNVNKSDAIKGLITKVGNTAGPAIGVPGLGTMITTGIQSADKITDGIENVVNNIKNKNPALALKDIKSVVTNIKDTVSDVTNASNMSDEQKKKVNDNVNKVYNALPSVIKEEGLEKVQKAAGYIPFLDSATMKITERTGKKGGVLKPKIRFTKPAIITKNADIFKKYGWSNYNPDTVGTIGGVIFSKEARENYKKRKEEMDKKMIQGRDPASKGPQAAIAKLEREGKHEEAEEMRERFKNNPWKTSMIEKSSGRTGLAGEDKECGRTGLAGELSDNEADEFIKQMRAKLQVKKIKK